MNCVHETGPCESGNVFACQCGAVAHAVCSNCSRCITQTNFPKHFSSPTQYDVSCSLCRDVLCIDCANSLLDPNSRHCYKCRASENADYIDEMAIGWIVTYHCGYIDRRNSVQSNTFTHPSMFSTRADAIDEC